MFSVPGSQGHLTLQMLCQECDSNMTNILTQHLTSGTTGVHSHQTDKVKSQIQFSLGIFIWMWSMTKIQNKFLG